MFDVKGFCLTNPPLSLADLIRFVEFGLLCPIFIAEILTLIFVLSVQFVLGRPISALLCVLFPVLLNFVATALAYSSLFSVIHKNIAPVILCYSIRDGY